MSKYNQHKEITSNLDKMPTANIDNVAEKITRTWTATEEIEQEAHEKLVGPRSNERQLAQQEASIATGTFRRENLALSKTLEEVHGVELVKWSASCIVRNSREGELEVKSGELKWNGVVVKPNDRTKGTQSALYNICSVLLLVFTTSLHCLKHNCFDYSLCYIAFHLSPIRTYQHILVVVFSRIIQKKSTVQS